MVIDSLLLGDFVGAWRSQEPSPPRGEAAWPQVGGSQDSPTPPWSTRVCPWSLCGLTPGAVCDSWVWDSSVGSDRGLGSLWLLGDQREPRSHRPWAAGPYWWETSEALLNALSCLPIPLVRPFTFGTAGDAAVSSRRGKETEAQTQEVTGHAGREPRSPEIHSVPRPPCSL